MAREFNGSSNRIIFTKSGASTDLSVLTYSFWIIRDTGGTNRNVFWSGGSWSATYHSFLQYDNGLSKLCFVANWTGAESRWSVPNTADDTVWHHHIITYDFGSTSNDPVWYIDNVLQTVTEVVTPSGSADYAKDDGTITLGAYDNGSAEYWDGKISDFAIFNRALTSDERAALAGGDSPAHYLDNGLVFYTTLKSNDLSDLISGNVGVNTGSTDFTHPSITYPTQSSPRYLIQGSI